MIKTIRRTVWLAALLALVAAGFSLPADDAHEPFSDLAPEADIIYLLANSSVILGPDPAGEAEDLTFVGTVWVPKFPLEGFERRRTEDGRYQIDFELTRSELRGESYLMAGPVVLGEHPDLRSLGTITQRQPGSDYPADFIVQRKVLIETPRGVMYNEDPVPVRGTIDAIPPIRHADHESAHSNLNVFRGEELPVALVDEDGAVAGWFYSRVHVAFAVEPRAIYRAWLVGEVAVEAQGEREVVAVEGPVEVLDREGQPGPELVMMALRGESGVLGGPIMVTEAFAEEGKASVGRFGDDGRFDLFLEIKSPAGILEVEGPVVVHGSSSAPERLDDVDLGRRGKVPVFQLALDQKGVGSNPIVDEAGRPVATFAGLSLAAERMAGRRPCCPGPAAKTNKAR